MKDTAPRVSEREQYRAVQAIAKRTIEWIKTQICPGMPLTKVREKCERHMLELGADSFWYWDVGAFVFAGEDTTLSVSGRTYQTGERVLGEDDILTIDLSPQRQGIWGDYARTIVLEGGVAAKCAQDIQNPVWRTGLAMEETLHRELARFASPDTTFEQLYEHMNAFIAARGFENLDFQGNLGHSIVREKSDRVYIEKGNSQRLSDAGLFTFEPHIRAKGGTYGFKMENIYFFENGTIAPLI